MIFFFFLVQIINENFLSQRYNKIFMMMFASQSFIVIIGDGNQSNHILFFASISFIYLSFLKVYYYFLVIYGIKIDDKIL